ncbi:MAG TPA: alpha/beta hydrolase [Phycisphaerae bacterium]|nr:alpha/beta hydrolase [Phycisphaerae bacterium]
MTLTIRNFRPADRQEGGSIGGPANVLLLVILTAVLLWGAGCGNEIIPIPVPCPSCDSTPETTCRYISLDDGTRIRTQYWPGDPNLPLVVGVHGFGGLYTDVQIVFPQGQFPALGFSMPGSLCSDRLPQGTPHTVDKAAETLAKVLEEYQDLIDQFGQNNLLIAGASFGALVVEDYFAKHPESMISAVVIAGQDTPETTGSIDIIAGYLNVVSFLFPATDNSHLKEYLASARVFDVSQQIVLTQNRWLIIGCADDDLTPGVIAMADRLGDRAQYAQIPGNHLMLLANGGNIRQEVLNHLDFLLHR